MVELGSGLVVPRAEGLPSIHRDDGTLVRRERDDLRIVRVNPDALVVISAWCAPPRREGVSAIGGLPGDDVRRIDDVGVLGVDLDLVEVTVPTPDPRIGVDPNPTLPRDGYQKA